MRTASIIFLLGTHFVLTLLLIWVATYSFLFMDSYLFTGICAWFGLGCLITFPLMLRGLLAE